MGKKINWQELRMFGDALADLGYLDDVAHIDDLVTRLRLHAAAGKDWTPYLEGHTLDLLTKDDYVFGLNSVIERVRASGSKRTILCPVTVSPKISITRHEEAHADKTSFVVGTCILIPKNRLNRVQNVVDRFKAVHGDLSKENRPWWHLSLRVKILKALLVLETIDSF